MGLIPNTTSKDYWQSLRVPIRHLGLWVSTWVEDFHWRTGVKWLTPRLPKLPVSLGLKQEAASSFASYAVGSCTSPCGLEPNWAGMKIKWWLTQENKWTESFMLCPLSLMDPEEFEFPLQFVSLKTLLLPLLPVTKQFMQHCVNAACMFFVRARLFFF